MKKILFIGIFFAILGVAIFLRLWHFGGVPVSPNWDEAALGYNAYSILQTGKDEYGMHLPFVLRSFGNYTPAVYAYLAIPFIAHFGLTVAATRLPAAIMGIFTVIGSFFLARELFSLGQISGARKNYLALLVMFLFAISPWHIQFSRIAYEAGPALAFVVWGFYFLLLGLKKTNYFFLSALFYGISINAYHSPRLFVPLFVLGIVILFRKQLLQQKQKLILPIIFGALFFIPIFSDFLTNQAVEIAGRFSETSIFNDTSTKPIIPQNNSIGYLLFDSNQALSFNQIINGYLVHFSPKWLFITGDNDRHHAPSTGLLYIWEAPFLLLGLIRLVKEKTKLKPVFFLWFFLAPVAASVTSEVPHAVRTLITLPLWQIATALGIDEFIMFSLKFSMLKRWIMYLLSFAVIFVLTFQYFDLYFFQMNHEVSRNWQFGYEHAVNYV